MSSVDDGSPQRSGSSTNIETGELFERWQQQGDATAPEELVERFMPLARSLARRYGRSAEPFEDLLQVASLGLLKAVDRFDPDRGYAFPSLAVPTILGEMRRYFRDCGWAVHMPRGAQERALRVRDAQERLTNERGRAPTVGQLAEYLELDIEEVIEALQALLSYEALSLDAPPAGGEDEAATCGETLGHEDERYELVELDATVSPALSVFPRASASSFRCASSRTSPSQRSQTGSASHRCRSRDCCAARLISCAR